jgi:hypothetical protein
MAAIGVLRELACVSSDRPEDEPKQRGILQRGCDIYHPRPINIGISVVSEPDVDLEVQSRDEYEQMSFFIWRT